MITDYSMPAYQLDLSMLTSDPLLQPHALGILHMEMLQVDPFYLCAIKDAPKPGFATLIFADRRSAYRFADKMHDVVPFEQWLEENPDE